jgi:biopolymer transport protein ExbD
VEKNLARRDKVVFISLIDILLQLVFVLLIVVIFLYKEYESLIVTYADLKKASSEKSQCENQKKQLESQKNQCELILNDLRKQYLQACMTRSKTSPIAAVKFKALTTNSVIFLEFTDEYFNYISEKREEIKLSKAKEMKSGSIIELKDIEKYFGFIRESDCYHEFSIIPIPTINSVESAHVRTKVSETFKRLSE